MKEYGLWIGGVEGEGKRDAGDEAGAAKRDPAWDARDSPGIGDFRRRQ